MPDYNVQVYTWGTDDKVSNGLDNFVDQQILGGNCGHASLRITVPSNESNLTLIDQYCLESFEEYRLRFEDPDSITEDDYENAPRADKAKIPFLEKVEQVPQPDGSVREVKYLEVDFSWWPSNVSGYYLSNLEQDMVSEQENVDVAYAQKWKDYLQLMEKKAVGKLGYREMTYSAFVITHHRELTDVQFQVVNDRVRIEQIREILSPVAGIFNTVRKLEKVDFESDDLKNIFDTLLLDPASLEEAYQQEVGGTGNLTSFRNYLAVDIGKKIELREKALTNIQRIDALKKVDFQSARLKALFTELGLDSETMQQDFMDKGLMEAVYDEDGQKVHSRLDNFKSYVREEVRKAYHEKGVGTHDLPFEKGLIHRKLR